MKKPAVDPLQALQQKLADTEALLQQERLKNQALQTVIEIGKKDGAARAVPSGEFFASAPPVGQYADPLRAVWNEPPGLV